MKYGYILERAAQLEMDDDRQLIEKSIGAEGQLFVERVYDIRDYRPKWLKLMDVIREGDELYIIGMSETGFGLREFSMLFDFCVKTKFRIVSIRDMIDTSIPEQARILYRWGTLPMDRDDFMKRENRIRNGGNRKKAKIKDETRAERNAQIVKLYEAKVPIESIMLKVGVRSNNTIYKILREAGIYVQRHVTSRTKHAAPKTEETQENQ
ncbi:MAG: hypothetical protein MJZ12_04520 [Prevotella sp.]|nr:hypothetical protein [Prevotella sp.]